MDRVQNCDSYINVLSSQTFRPYMEIFIFQLNRFAVSGACLMASLFPLTCLVVSVY
jgi:hypothetical protein